MMLNREQKIVHGLIALGAAVALAVTGDPSLMLLIGCVTGLAWRPEQNAWGMTTVERTVHGILLTVGVLSALLFARGNAFLFADWLLAILWRPSDAGVPEPSVARGPSASGE